MARRALVTGASSGMGAEFARVLAGEGMDVVLVARDQERLDALAAELSGDTEVIVADLSTEDGISRIEQRLSSEEKPVDFLVNNAGHGIKGAFVDIDWETQKAMLEVNVMAVVRLTHAAAKSMVARKHGDIINMASVAAFTPALRPSSTYAASKAFVAAFSEGLAPSLAVSGVTVSVLAPGWVRTDFHNRAGIGMSKLPGFMWLDPRETVVASLKDHRAGKTLSVPGATYKVIMFGLRLLPRKLQTAISRKITGRHKH